MERRMQIPGAPLFDFIILHKALDNRTIGSYNI